MQPVKGRHAPLLKGLGALFSGPPHKPLDYGELGKLLGATEEAVKSWARRGVPDWAKLRVLELAEERSPEHLRDAKRLLQGVAEGPGSPRAARSDASEGHRRGVVSEPLGVEETAWRGFRVLASRIARTIEHTVHLHELGYTTASRVILADSLAVFARELDRRCGETVSGDIWKVIDWLRKPEGK